MARLASLTKCFFVVLSPTSRFTRGMTTSAYSSCSSRRIAMVKQTAVLIWTEMMSLRPPSTYWGAATHCTVWRWTFPICRIWKCRHCLLNQRIQKTPRGEQNMKHKPIIFFVVTNFYRPLCPPPPFFGYCEQFEFKKLMVNSSWTWSNIHLWFVWHGQFQQFPIEFWSICWTRSQKPIQKFERGVGGDKKRDIYTSRYSRWSYKPMQSVANFLGLFFTGQGAKAFLAVCNN